VGRDVIEEKSAGEPLSDQPPEDIGKGDDHRVDLAALDLLAQLVEGLIARGAGHGAFHGATLGNDAAGVNHR
jgi:hypothetical protein